MVNINGTQVFADGLTLSEYLKKEGYNTERIAVEINLQIIPKADFDKTIIKSNDTIEIVSFVGGG